MLNYSKLGAQILQATINGKSLLYLASTCHDANCSARGGVPVLFPQFAECGLLKKHGFVRELPWQLVEDNNHAKGQRLVFELEIPQGKRPDWSHSVKLVLTALLTPISLKMYLRIHNTGNTQFVWTGGLHTYIYTDDLCASQLIGLQGVTVQDRYDPIRTRETEATVRWNGNELERLYDNKARLVLQTPTHTVELSMSGFDQWMVWNPGITGAQSLKDLADQDWRHFVCIEPVRINRPSVLHPGEVFDGGLEMIVHANAYAELN